MKSSVVISKLRGLRAERNLTLDEVSKGIGIGRCTLSVYENGQSKMPLNVLLDLLEYYDVPVNIFFNNICDNSR